MAADSRSDGVSRSATRSEARGDDLSTALWLVEALIDDDDRSTDLLLEAAGDLRTTLRLAAMVVGLLDGDSAAEKRVSLASFALALQLQEGKSS